VSNTRVALKKLRVGRKEYFSNLALFPLLSNKTVDAEYLTLDAALAAGQIHIAEVSADGDSASLKIMNRSSLPVLIVDGEELPGPKQDRVAIVTVLVPPQQKIIIPVCCVESGRWTSERWADDLFTRAPTSLTHFAAGRRRRNADVSAALRGNGTRTISQWKVWDDINKKSQRMAVNSPTRSMADIFAWHANHLKHYVNAFSCNPMQVGVVFAINEHIEGVELFDSPVTLASLYPKLIRSYAIDAIENAGKQKPLASRRDARRFLRSVMQVHEDRYEAIGLGEEIRVSGEEIVGGGLLLDNRLLHLAAFANPTPSAAEITTFNPPSLAYP